MICPGPRGGVAAVVREGGGDICAPMEILPERESILRGVNVEDAVAFHHHDAGWISGKAASQSCRAAWIRASTLAEDSSRRGLSIQPQVHRPLLL